MPKFTLPKPKKEKVSGPIEVSEPYWPESSFIPASKEIIDSLEIGETVEVTLTGKVTMKELRENEGTKGPKAEFRIELSSVSVPETNDFAKMAEDD